MHTKRIQVEENVDTKLDTSTRNLSVLIHGLGILQSYIGMGDIGKEYIAMDVIVGGGLGF